MKAKTIRMKTLKMLISSKELSSQEEVLKALAKEGFTITQATLSRDLKQLKVAKAASMNGKYVYVLPNETMYKRVSSPQRATDMANSNGFLSLTFSGQLAVMKTRPGYASAVAYDIDQKEIQGVLGSIAGDDTLFIAIEEGFDREKIVEGAVSMVHMALDRLGNEHIVELDEERKAAMVSNLLVVLCADEAAQPVVNAGTLHH